VFLNAFYFVTVSVEIKLNEEDFVLFWLCEGLSFIFIITPITALLVFEKHLLLKTFTWLTVF
jgi:hypothetical protein